MAITEANRRRGELDAGRGSGFNWKVLKMERVLAFEDPFVSPNRLFPCGSGYNQNRYPIPGAVPWGYRKAKKNGRKILKQLTFNELKPKKNRENHSVAFSRPGQMPGRQA